MTMIKHLKKKGITLLMAGVFGIASFSAIVAIPSVPVFATEAGIQPLSDVIEWVYKEINGKMYKRLYNYTLHQWVGDWIPCKI